ncbi:serine hydrolase domain-containing protein [Streptomyces sp. CBMA156]|uniref:serine hydrolase domain-containing protein n=1 Tax=Streptomyces sp. CBMA156 TaxID=1930280 RepID=UPI001661FFC2|nr:serine hydrolase domain-containing protein [Streptomyces sp. CBMA156]MBD0671181.1 peptide hydrolase [Streptomyces sp. CBMA156]
MTSILRKHLVVAAGVAVLLAASAANAVARPAGSSPAERLRRDTAAIHHLGIAGVQARMVEPDGRQTVATSGTADVTTGRPVSPDGYFRMASTAKTMVATVVLQLEAEGRLSLDDTLGHWLPEVARAKGGGGIAVRRLLQHTGGIKDHLPGYAKKDEYERERYQVHSAEELVAGAEFLDETDWRYSNTGYILLDMIIERATGRPAEREIEDRVLRPLGLDRTRSIGTSPTLPRPHAQAYQLFPAPDGRVDVTEQVPLVGGLSWVTTTRDENAFLRALLGGRLLPARQLAEMKETVPVDSDTATMWQGGQYGLGLVERSLTCGGTYWGHEGGDGGYITLNGVTGDGRRSAVVSMSEARGDTWDHILAQEDAAGALIDHALCAGSPGSG